MQDDDNLNDRGDDGTIDMPSAEADIRLGAAKLAELLEHSGDDWKERWAVVIVGFRVLRNLAYGMAQTTNIRSQAYRNAMSELLRQYPIYERIDPPTRSAMYRLCDRVEDVTHWYLGLSGPDKFRWKHPQTVVKHCPKHLLTDNQCGHHKQPKKPGKKKRGASAEEDRLRALLLEVIAEAEAGPITPQRAAELRKQIWPAGEEMNDSLNGLFDEDKNDDDDDDSDDSDDGNVIQLMD